MQEHKTKQFAAPDTSSSYQLPSTVERGHSDERGHREIAARRLQIYGFDPQLGRRRKFRMSLEIPYEKLEALPGQDGIEERLRKTRPKGRVVDVVDYDATADCYYSWVDLDAPDVLAGGGLPPRVDDPQFHQQMVYAVAMKVVANFERALGRRLDFDEPLTLLPHAFRGRNAFFHPSTNSIAFGYFRADAENPGENLPNQWVFTSMSHDIIAHEMTHALIHHLRPHFFESTNPDVFAFHEAIADIVAIFQHFGFPGVLADAVQRGRADLSQPSELLNLAKQFGHSTGGGAALRTAADSETIDAGLYSETFEPHDRGSVLVRAVFDAFFRTYTSRVEDLIRIATGGSGQLGAGYLQPDLVNRVTEEAGDTAQRVLDLCIRAFDYLPPIDVTFSDYLRALVTADIELNPDDPYDLRSNLVDAFFARGIHPAGVFSLNEESLLWKPPADSLIAYNLSRDVLDRLAGYQAERWGAKTSRAARREWTEVNDAFRTFGMENAPALELDPNLYIEVKGFYSMFRIGADGQLLTEAGVQFVQTPEIASGDLGGLVPRAGTTVIFSGDGSVRYVIAKPLQLDVGLPGQLPGEEDPRLQAMRKFVAACDERDPHYAWAGPAYDVASRMLRRFNFALVHQVIEPIAIQSDDDAGKEVADA